MDGGLRWVWSCLGFCMAFFFLRTCPSFDEIYSYRVLCTMGFSDGKDYAVYVALGCPRGMICRVSGVEWIFLRFLVMGMDCLGYYEVLDDWWMRVDGVRRCSMELWFQWWVSGMTIM